MTYSTHDDAQRFEWTVDAVDHDVFTDATMTASTSTMAPPRTMNNGSSTEAWGGSLPATHPELVDHFSTDGLAPSPWAVTMPQQHLYAAAPMLVQHAMQPSPYLRTERRSSMHAPTLMIRPPSWRDGMVGLLIGIVALALPVAGAIAWGMQGKPTTPPVAAAAVAPAAGTTALPAATTFVDPTTGIVAPAADALGTTTAPAAGGMGAAPSTGAAASKAAVPAAGPAAATAAPTGTAPARTGTPGRTAGPASTPTRGGGPSAAQAAQQAAAQQLAAQQAAAQQAAARPPAAAAPAPTPAPQVSERKAVAWTATSVATGHTWDMPEGQDAQIKDDAKFSISPKYADGTLGPALPHGQSIPD